MASSFPVPSYRPLLVALLIAVGSHHAAHAANTPQTVAAAFRSLTGDQVLFVIQRDPGMKRAYDEAGPMLQNMMRSNPAGFPWDNVTRNRDQATLDRIAALIAQAKGGTVAPNPPAGPSLAAGSVITAEPPTDGGVYMVDPSGAKRHIANPAVFNGCGLDWGRIQKLPPALVNGLATGATLRTAQECQALKAGAATKVAPGLAAGSTITAEPRTDGAVYMVDANGSKWPIANPDVFNGCGLDWGRIQKLPPAMVNGMATGPLLRTAQECQALKAGTPIPPAQQTVQGQQPAQQNQAPAQQQTPTSVTIDLNAKVPATCSVSLTAAVDSYQLEPAGTVGLFMRMSRAQMTDVLEMAKSMLFWTPKAMQKVLQDKLHDLEPEARCAAMLDVVRRERGSYPGAELNRLLRVVADYNASRSGTAVVGNEIRATRIHDGAPQPCAIQPAPDPKLRAGQCHQLAMAGVNLSGRDLTRMMFTNSVMTRANLNGAKLAYSGFSGSDLNGADFSNADLTGASLIGAKLDGAKFAGARLGRVKGFPGTPAGHVCSSDSVGTCKPVREINGCVIEPGVLDLSRGRAQPGSDCSYADLRNADLRNADLTMMKFERANFAGADLSGAKFFGTHLVEANLTGAKIAGTRFDGANLLHAAWIDGKFCAKASPPGQCQPIARVGDCWIEPGADCRAVGSLTNGNFTGLNLAGVNLEGVDLSRATFANADVSEANLFRAKLDGAGFLGAKVRPDGATCARGTSSGPVCVLGDGSRVTVGVDVANGGRREATLVTAPPGGRVVYVHNLCQDARAISVKNSVTPVAGEYLDIAGPGQKDLLIPSGGEAKLPAPGKLHRVHFQGNYLAGVDLKNDTDHVYIKPGSCDMVVGNPATIGNQLATMQRTQVVTIVNQCVQPESLAIKNDETGEYQKIGADAKTPMDRKVAVNGADMVTLYGSRFWVHFSGLVVAGMGFEGSGQIIIERGGAPCKLRFVRGPSPAEGAFRVTQLRTRNERLIAQNYARMVEAATYGRATPEEMVQINDFLAFASMARVQAADLALERLKGWREMTKEHNPRCVDRKATALQPRDYTPQQAAAEGFTIPLTFDGKEKFCRFEPRYTVTTDGRPANVNLGMLFNANNETGEITPPDDYLNLAMAGVPIRSFADSDALNKAMASAGGALGALAVGGALATAAAVGPAAVAIATGVTPFALHGIAVGTAAEAAIAGGVAAAAFAAPAIAASVVIAIAAPMLMDIIKNLEYEPKILELRRSYASVPYTLEALRTSEGRHALFTHYVRYANSR